MSHASTLPKGSYAMFSGPLPVSWPRPAPSFGSDPESSGFWTGSLRGHKLACVGSFWGGSVCIVPRELVTRRMAKKMDIRENDYVNATCTDITFERDASTKEWFMLYDGGRECVEEVPNVRDTLCLEEDYTFFRNG